MQPDPIPRGLCQCGCGERTNLARQNDTTLGYTKGEPVFYIAGHATRRTPHAYEVRDCGYVTPCWVWVRRLTALGYGWVKPPGSDGPTLAHIAYWEERHGPVPERLELDHLCRNPPCVNPDHLEPVPHVENLRRGAGTSLTAADVRAIRTSTDTPLALAQRHGVSRSNIYNVLHFKSWKDVSP